VTRRFDIGPVLVALGALVLLVGLFLDWYGGVNAWNSFEVTDVLLALLGVAGLGAAAGVLADTELVDRRALPWIAGAAFVLVAAELINPTPGATDRPLGLGAWLCFGAALAMVVGTVLTFGRVSVAVAVEGRDRRRRLAAVDHRPPPTETGAPVAPATRSTDPLLRSRSEGEEAGGSLLRPRTDEGEAPGST
jgi:hypothetical protein